MDNEFDDNDHEQRRQAIRDGARAGVYDRIGVLVPSVYWAVLIFLSICALANGDLMILLVPFTYEPVQQLIAWTLGLGVGLVAVMELPQPKQIESGFVEQIEFDDAFETGRQPRTVVLAISFVLAIMAAMLGFPPILGAATLCVLYVSETCRPVNEMQLMHAIRRAARIHARRTLRGEYIPPDDMRVTPIREGVYRVEFRDLRKRAGSFVATVGDGFVRLH